MTVGVEQINWAYTGNGATDVWGFTFSSKSDSDVEVYLKEGVLAEVKLNPADYTLSRTDSGGNVTYPKTGSKLTSSDRIAVKRNSVKGNDYDFKSQARVNTIEIENSDDDKARQIQELEEAISRSVLVDPTSTISPADLLAQLTVDVAAAAVSAAAALTSENNALASANNAEADAILAQAAVNGVRVSADDTTGDNLEAKIIGGDNVFLETVSPGGNEQLKITVDSSVGSKIFLATNYI